jgi:hypothetical protein
VAFVLDVQLQGRKSRLQPLPKPLFTGGVPH